jgi:polyribonucleotide nucleotidyltransferase
MITEQKFKAILGSKYLVSKNIASKSNVLVKIKKDDGTIVIVDPSKYDIKNNAVIIKDEGIYNG